MFFKRISEGTHKTIDYDNDKEIIGGMIGKHIGETLNKLPGRFLKILGGIFEGIIRTNSRRKYCGIANEIRINFLRNYRQS